MFNFSHFSFKIHDKWNFKQNLSLLYDEIFDFFNVSTNLRSRNWANQASQMSWPSIFFLTGIQKQKIHANVDRKWRNYDTILLMILSNFIFSCKDSSIYTTCSSIEPLPRLRLWAIWQWTIQQPLLLKISPKNLLMTICCRVKKLVMVHFNTDFY